MRNEMMQVQFEWMPDRKRGGGSDRPGPCGRRKQDGCHCNRVSEEARDCMSMSTFELSTAISKKSASGYEQCGIFCTDGKKDIGQSRLGKRLRAGG